MMNPQPTNIEQTTELLRSVLSSVGAHPHLSDAQLRLLGSLKKDSQSGDTSQEQTTIAPETQEIDCLNEQPIKLSLILESLRKARATSCSQLKAEHSFVKTIFGIKVFDDTIGAALTNGVLAAFPTSYIFAGLGYVATDDLGYRVGGRNYQPLVPGQKSGDINDANLYVQHADRNRFFDVGIERIPVILGNYDQLKTAYYTQFLNTGHQREIKNYVSQQTQKEQHTAQDLEDLTNLAQLLESSQQNNDDQEKIKEFLQNKQDEFQQNYTSSSSNEIKPSDIFFIEKFLSGEINFNESLTLDNMLRKVNNYQLQTGGTTFEDQQIARIKYELLDKKYNQGERTEELKNQTLRALNNARSIAEKRQEDFLEKLNQLFANGDFNDCRDSTNFYDKLNSKKDELTNYKDLFDSCEHWASHHPQCSDGLKEFLEAVVENKKQTTNYLLTKGRTFTEKAKDVANFYKSLAALGGIFVVLKKLDLEHHFAEWGREAGIAISNSSVGHYIANSSLVHTANAFTGTVANSSLAHTANAFAGTVANSAPVHAISTGIISATKGLACLVGAIKSIPMAPVVVAGVAAVTATGVYLRGIDYPEPKSIQDIISVAKKDPSGFCSCYHSHSMGEQEVTISI